MDTILTKDANKLLCILYKSYLQKRKSGSSKSDACEFGSSQDIREELLPEYSFEDVDYTCFELAQTDFIDCFEADGIAYRVLLNSQGIAFMENRFKNGLSEVVDFISKFVP